MKPIIRSFVFAVCDLLSTASLAIAIFIAMGTPQYTQADTFLVIAGIFFGLFLSVVCTHLKR